MRDLIFIVTATPSSSYMHEARVVVAYAERYAFQKG